MAFVPLMACVFRLRMIMDSYLEYDVRFTIICDSSPNAVQHRVGSDQPIQKSDWYDAVLM